MTHNQINLNESIGNSIGDALKGMGKINILIVGRTGVGKSTLINTVFRGDLAEVGVGSPVTQKIEEISKQDFPISIFDTKGLELKDYDSIIDDIETLIDDKSHDHDENKHIHIAWLCIHEDGRRVEDAEKDLCKSLKERNIPIVVAITKSRSDQGFREKVKEILPEVNSIVSVRAIPETIEDDDDVITLKEKGIDNLITETEKLLPEGKKNAYSNALDSRHASALRLKIERAEKEINAAVALATAAAATPIPFSDAVTLVPIQVGMLAKISLTFGMNTSSATLSTLVSAAIGSSAATLIGRTVVTNLLKLVPGAGSLIGGAIAAGTAATLTKALGKAYLEILKDFTSNNPGKELDVSLIANELKAKMNLFK